MTNSSWWANPIDELTDSTDCLSTLKPPKKGTAVNIETATQVKIIMPKSMAIIQDQIILIIVLLIVQI